MLFSGDLLGNKFLAWDQLLILINIIPCVLFVLMHLAVYVYEFENGIQLLISYVPEILKIIISWKFWCPVTFICGF